MKFTLKFWRWEKYPVDRSFQAIQKFQSHFDKQENDRLRIIEESMVSPRHLSDDLALLNTCKWIVEIPIPVTTGAMDVKERLTDQGNKRVFQILSTLDNAELRILDSVSSAPDLLARIKTFREELKEWRKQISSGDFEIRELIPLNDHVSDLPRLSQTIPYKPSPLEPEYFRQVFLNPEQDIPFVLEALFRLGFVDENHQWRLDEYSRYGIAGVVLALINSEMAFLCTTNWTQLTERFCQRLGLEVKPRIERGKGDYQVCEKKLKEYLRLNISK